MTQLAPWIYQGQGDAAAEVDGAYALLGDGRVGFTIGDYDPSQPLIRRSPQPSAI